MKKKTVTKEAIFLVDRGENCTCADCPVLYGGECMTGITPKKRLFVGKVKIPKDLIK